MERQSQTKRMAAGGRSRRKPASARFEPARGGSAWALTLSLLMFGAAQAGGAQAGGAQAAPTAPITFEGARLGMSEAAWKASAPPGTLPPHARAACSDDADADAPAPTAAERAAGLVICAYVDAYGRFRLPVSFVLDGKYRVRDMRFSFAGDRLVRIRCDASTDAYDALVADFQARYGPAVSLVRDRVRTELGPLPRVTQSWSTPSGSIRLVDPTPPYTALSLRFSANASRPPARAIGAAG